MLSIAAPGETNEVGSLAPLALIQYKPALCFCFLILYILVVFFPVCSWQTPQTHTHMVPEAACAGEKNFSFLSHGLRATLFCSLFDSFSSYTFFFWRRRKGGYFLRCCLKMESELHIVFAVVRMSIKWNLQRHATEKQSTCFVFESLLCFATPDLKCSLNQALQSS